MFKVLVTQTLTGKSKEYLEAHGCQVFLGLEEVAKEENKADCDAILAGGSGGLLYDRAFMEACPKCKCICTFSAGVERIDLDAAAELGIQVCNSGTANSNAVAEHTIFLLLACAKADLYMADAVRAGDFDIRHRMHMVEVEDKTLGVLGFGNIGRRVAKKAALGLDMKILVYDPFAKKENMPEYAELVENIEDLLPRCDFVTLHLPLMESTEHFFNMDMIRRMKPTAYLLNAARGPLVHEPDLIKALKEGVIAGAGLDVFEEEPSPTDNPLFFMKNVICTPHSASNTNETLDRMDLYAAENIVAILNGQEPKFKVNKPVVKR